MSISGFTLSTKVIESNNNIIKNKLALDNIKLQREKLRQQNLGKNKFKGFTFAKKTHSRYKAIADKAIANYRDWYTDNYMEIQGGQNIDIINENAERRKALDDLPDFLNKNADNLIQLETTLNSDDFQPETWKDIFTMNDEGKFEWQVQAQRDTSNDSIIWDSKSKSYKISGTENEQEFTEFLTDAPGYNFKKVIKKEDVPIGKSISGVYQYTKNKFISSNGKYTDNSIIEAKNSIIDMLPKNADEEPKNGSIGTARNYYLKEYLKSPEAVNQNIQTWSEKEYRDFNEYTAKNILDEIVKNFPAKKEGTPLLAIKDLKDKRKDINVTFKNTEDENKLYSKTLYQYSQSTIFKNPVKIDIDASKLDNVIGSAEEGSFEYKVEGIYYINNTKIPRVPKTDGDTSTDLKYHLLLSRGVSKPVTNQFATTNTVKETNRILVPIINNSDILNILNLNLNEETGVLKDGQGNTFNLKGFNNNESNEQTGGGEQTGGRAPRI